MQRLLPYALLVFLIAFSGCNEESEQTDLNLELDYHPLEVGLFWIYDTDETVYFGVNDSKSESFFYKDKIRSSYLNDALEVVYIIERSKSTDKSKWLKAYEYTRILRNNSILETVFNKSKVSLVFPPKEGKTWNGNIYQAEGNDDFEIEEISPSKLPQYSGVTSAFVNQENFDDKVTLRDIRYDIYGKGIGMLEKYEEVVTYCSRNDCLGQQLINGGKKSHLILVEHGKE